jgi:hypothetical protein
MSMFTHRTASIPLVGIGLLGCLFGIGPNSETFEDCRWDPLALTDVCCNDWVTDPISYTDICCDSSDNPICGNPDMQCATSGLASADLIVQVGVLSGSVSGYQGSCGGTGPDEDFTYVAPLSGLYVITIEPIDGSDAYDPILYVLGGDCKAGELACNDDWSGLNPRVELYLSAGEEITIIVDGYTNYISSSLDYRLTVALESDQPLGTCGWDGTQSFPGYYCGGTGADPSGTFPFACPADLVVGNPCGPLSGQGCCDVNGNLWFCTSDTEPVSLVQEVCP